MSTETTTHGPQHVRARIGDAITAEYLRRVAEEVNTTPQEHCDALTNAVLTALRTIAAEMEQQYWGGNCPQCAAYLANLAALVQERVGKHACPLCAEYLALKERAESSEAEERPLVDLASRTEPTYRERIAAALFEQQQRQPWAMAYPCDVLNYLHDADAFLGIRDAAMTELRQQAARSDAVTAETKALMEQRTTTLRERAERAEAVTLQALTGLTGDGGFARGFRLVQRDGLVLDGAVFPSGRCFVLDDSEYGFSTVAVSVAELLRGGYHGARIEFAGGSTADENCKNCGHAAHGHAEHLTNSAALTDCPQCPCAAELREMSGEADNDQEQPAATGLPAAEACRDPRHTGSVREQLGCTGPDPAEATDE